MEFSVGKEMVIVVCLKVKRRRGGTLKVETTIGKKLPRRTSYQKKKKLDGRKGGKSNQLGAN